MRVDVEYRPCKYSIWLKRGNTCYGAKWYGRGWRCWTSRPTDEQRKAAKWDD